MLIQYNLTYIKSNSKFLSTCSIFNFYLQYIYLYITEKNILSAYFNGFQGIKFTAPVVTVVCDCAVGFIKSVIFQLNIVSRLNCFQHTFFDTILKSIRQSGERASTHTCKKSASSKFQSSCIWYLLCRYTLSHV